MGEAAVPAQPDGLRQRFELVRIALLDVPGVARGEPELSLGLRERDGLEGLRGHAAVLPVHVGQVEVLAEPGEDESLVAELAVGDAEDAVALLPGLEQLRAVPAPATDEPLGGKALDLHREQVLEPARAVGDGSAQGPGLAELIAGAVLAQVVGAEAGFQPGVGKKGGQLLESLPEPREERGLVRLLLRCHPFDRGLDLARRFRRRLPIQLPLGGQGRGREDH